jgi:hypothetical protein
LCGPFFFPRPIRKAYNRRSRTRDASVAGERNSPSAPVQFRLPGATAMKKLTLLAAALALAAAPSFAQVKPCEELKAEIAKKLDDKGVKNYTLDIVDNDQVGDRKVVGSCDGGTKKIVYVRN